MKKMGRTHFKPPCMFFSHGLRMQIFSEFVKLDGQKFARVMYTYILDEKYTFLVIIFISNRIRRSICPKKNARKWSILMKKNLLSWNVTHWEIDRAPQNSFGQSFMKSLCTVSSNGASHSLGFVKLLGSRLTKCQLMVR